MTALYMWFQSGCIYSGEHSVSYLKLGVIDYLKVNGGLGLVN